MTEKQESYEVEIDGQLYLVIPGLRKSQEGKGVSDTELDVQGDPHRPVLTEDELAALVPDPGAREWARTTRRTRTILKGVRPPGVTQLCANDRCTNLVPPSKNPGIERIFCDPICARRYHQRLYSARNAYGVGSLERNRETGEQVQFNRRRPDTLAKAETRYHAHIQRPEPDGEPVCPNATDETRGRCPAHILGDYYSQKRLCLIYAVLVEDMKEQAAKSRGEFYYRQWTTPDGRWKEDFTEDPDVAVHLKPMAERTRDISRVERLLAEIGQAQLMREAEQGISEDEI